MSISPRTSPLSAAIITIIRGTHRLSTHADATRLRTRKLAAEPPAFFADEKMLPHTLRGML